MKFKVEDKVNVRRDLEVGNSYSDYTSVEDVSVLKEKNIDDFENSKNKYVFADDKYASTNKILEPVED